MCVCLCQGRSPVEGVRCRVCHHVFVSVRVGECALEWVRCELGESIVNLCAINVLLQSYTPLQPHQ